MMRDQNDSHQVYVIAVFESEKAARARENDPRREAALQPVRALMAEMFEGSPQFVDLTVEAEEVPSSSQRIVQVTRQLSRTTSGQPGRQAKVCFAILPFIHRVQAVASVLGCRA